jgi:hypothetical protein
LQYGTAVKIANGSGISVWFQGMDVLIYAIYVKFLRYAANIVYNGKRFISLAKIIMFFPIYLSAGIPSGLKAFCYVQFSAEKHEEEQITVFLMFGSH